MSKTNPITFIVLRVRNANNGILGKDWRREISIGEDGTYSPFPQSRKQEDLPSEDPYKVVNDYYDEVFTQNSDNPFTFSIKITPPENAPDSYFWELEGKYRYLGRGKGLEGIHAPPYSFSSGIAPDQANEYDTIQLDAYVSMIRDSTDHALASVREKMIKVTKWPWQKTPSPVINQEPEGVYYIGSPLLQDNDPRVRIDRDSGINPDTTEIVFELKENVGAPRLIAISWPNTIDEKKLSVPMLVYFHPHHNQNAAFYGKSPYPWGKEYVINGLWNTLIYIKDPLIESPYEKGMPYQIAKSGKDVVLVCPQNKMSQQTADPKELGIFMKAKWMHWILYEICAYMYRSRQKYIYPVPKPGGVAFASFSLGTKFATDFLDLIENKNSIFTKEILQEVYFFDPPRDGKHACIDQPISERF